MQKSHPNHKLPLQDPLLSELVLSKLITMDDALRISTQAKQGLSSITHFLIAEEKIPHKEVALALSRSFQLDFIDLDDITKSTIPNQLLNDSFIKEHHVLPLFIRDHTLYFGIREPAQLSSCKPLQFHTDLQIQPVITEWHKLARLITYYLNEQQYQIFKQPFTTSDRARDKQVVSFVQHIIEDAIMKSASDIHFEPYKTHYRIRARIDGILHKITELPIETSQRITARLKMMSKLNIAEKRLPQDGRFNIQAGEKTSRDCRISTCPTLHGEKTVIRILESDSASLSINELGMSPEQQSLFLTNIKKPQGMILVTGPTGSGKTLTLYSGLNILNTMERNISTVEDPIEIELSGINQVHVDTKANLSFQSILRAFLRQDPDILMIGEIRDLETAELSIKSAQTGHLVLSTLHTNSAYETLSRLQMMGIKRFNLIDATRLIIAQRLVRKLCPLCKSVVQLPKETLLSAGFLEHELESLISYQPTGCEHCTHGYKGRSGIFECLSITDKIKQLITEQATTTQIQSSALEDGFITLQTSALNKVREGITSLEEFYRVVV